MAGMIASDLLGGNGYTKPAVMWELFYGDNGNWILYGTQKGYSIDGTGNWEVTITLGTGASKTVTIFPNYSVSSAFPLKQQSDTFYVTFSLETPSKNTTIKVSVTSEEYDSSGIGEFSGDYLYKDTPKGSFLIQNLSVKATAKSNFTWSFDVTIDGIEREYIDPEGNGSVHTYSSNAAIKISTKGITFTEKYKTRTYSFSKYDNNFNKFQIKFTAEGGSVSDIKRLYAGDPSAASLSLTLYVVVAFITDVDGFPTYSDEADGLGRTEIKVVTPPPTVSDGWLTTAVNNLAAGGSDAFQFYIKNKSRVRALFDASKINVSDLCGATIAKYKLAMNGVTYSVQNVGAGTALNTNVLTRLGDNTLTVSAVDTRGLEYKLGDASVFVHDYAEPTLSNISIYRCDSAGIQDDRGTYLYLRALASIASVDGHNSVVLKARYKPTSGGYGDYIALSNNEPLITGDGLVDTASAYEAEIVAIDTAGFSATYVTFISTEIVTFSVKDGGKAVGVGMIVSAEADNTHHIAFDTYLHGDLILGKTRLTEEQLIKLLEMI